MPAEGSLTLLGFKIKTVKADVLQQRVTLTFAGLMDDQLSDATERLQAMNTHDETLNLTIETQAMQLPIRTFGSDRDPFQDDDT